MGVSRAALSARRSGRSLFLPTDGDSARLNPSVYETYQSNLTKSEDDLFKGMDSACRRCIRKAEKSGVVVEEAHDAAFADDTDEQLQDVFAEAGTRADL